MNDKLKHLIATASERLEAAEAERQMQRKESEEELDKHLTAAFKRHVEDALGEEVLEAIGPISYQGMGRSNEMIFEQEGHKFRLKQVTDTLVNFEVYSLFDGKHASKLQFNLRNEDARGRFLQALGKAIQTT
jgi:hypothetical protein